MKKKMFDVPKTARDNDIVSNFVGKAVDEVITLWVCERVCIVVVEMKFGMAVLTGQK